MKGFWSSSSRIQLFTPLNVNIISRRHGLVPGDHFWLESECLCTCCTCVVYVHCLFHISPLDLLVFCFHLARFCIVTLLVWCLSL